MNKYISNAFIDGKYPPSSFLILSIPEFILSNAEEMSYSKLVAKTEEYERLYNNEHPHSELSYKSPREEYEEYVRLTKVA